MSIRSLLKVPFELPEDIISILEENSEIVSFLKNETIVNPDEVDDNFYIIASGLARIFYRRREDGAREDNILFGEKGNIAASLSSFMLGIPSAFGIAAVTRLRAYKIKGEIIRKLYRSDFTFCRWLAELSLIQIAHLEVRYRYLAPTDAYERYLNFRRFKTASFMRRVPLYHIASYLNISPTTLSLLRSRYGRDKENNVGYDKEFLDRIGMTGQVPEQ